MQKLAGIFCAFWTPTDRNGEILWPVIDQNLQFIIDSGIHGFMALGSTAEFPHLTLDQRKEILQRLVRSGLPVIANVSDVSHRNAIHLARHAKQSGAMAAAVLPPWFFPMAQRDIAEFFIAISRAAELPLLLYNFPEVTGKKIEPKTIQQVARTVPVIAVKQSGADFAYHHELLRLAKEHGFSVLTGADTNLEQALQLGCSGTISGMANAVPDVLRKTYDNFQENTSSPNQSAFLAELGRQLGTLEFPLNVKALIAARGYETGELKNPVSNESLQRYETLLANLKGVMPNVVQLV
jgi:4-hydroxy-tetrahydrodipicolinate synthase